MLRRWTHNVATSALRHALPGRLRSTLKRAATVLGLYDPNAGRLGLQRLYDDDVFITSYPKSGNTWIRFLIAHMHDPGEPVSFRNIEQFVPTVNHSNRIIENAERPRYMKTHGPHFERFPRFIYIYRDVRDVAISYYNYCVDYGWTDASFDTFIRSPWPWQANFGAWSSHVNGALQEAESRPEDVLILRYEDMLRDAHSSAKRIAAFTGITSSEQVIRNAVEASSFDQLQSTEKKFGPESKRHNSVKFFRSGTSGQWKDILSNEQLKVLMDRFEATLKKTGYVSATGTTNSA